jgi:hypothetical protein
VTPSERVRRFAGEPDSDLSRVRSPNALPPTALRPEPCEPLGEHLVVASVFVRVVDIIVRDLELHEVHVHPLPVFVDACVDGTVRFALAEVVDQPVGDPPIDDECRRYLVPEYFAIKQMAPIKGRHVFVKVEELTYVEFVVEAWVGVTGRAAD